MLGPHGSDRAKSVCSAGYRLSADGRESNQKRPKTTKADRTRTRRAAYRAWRTLPKLYYSLTVSRGWQQLTWLKGSPGGLRAGRKHRGTTLRQRRTNMGQERLRGNGELYSVTVDTITQTDAKATRSRNFCMREFLAHNQCERERKFGST
jgi:hypothetical protein